MGVILPVVSFISFYLIRYGDIPLREFLNYIYFREVISPLLSLNILPNLILFLFFIRLDYLLAARGVLMATFLFAGIVLLLKIIS